MKTDSWEAGQRRKAIRASLKGYTTQEAGAMDKRATAQTSDRANARLIAAAPELAEALRDMIALADWLHDSMPKHRETVGCPDAAKRINLASAALAKAGVA